MRAEITTLDALRAHRAAGGDLRRAVLVGLDLTDPDDDALVRGTALDEAVLLGCVLLPPTLQRAQAAAALVFPSIPGLPYRPYRSTLYAASELFDGFDPARPESYADTLDALVYAYVSSPGGAGDGHARVGGGAVGRIGGGHVGSGLTGGGRVGGAHDGGAGAHHPDPLHALAERLHDHSITAALDDVLAAARAAGRAAPVAVMGGHALDRDSPAYRAAVLLGRELGRSPARFTVLTGGGPGAMEAVPLGVRLATLDDDTLDAALAELATAPSFRGNAGGGVAVDAKTIGGWLAAALRVPCAGYLEPAVASPDELPRTIGIPTWFYGHEPPNAFCDAHAKYFANSVREDGLLTIATGGVIYTPGSAGTVQEIFADYTQNHYCSVGPPAPMIFLGTRFWTEDLPAAPLVQRLAAGRDIEPWIVITDDIPHAVTVLTRYATGESPVPYT